MNRNRAVTARHARRPYAPADVRRQMEESLWTMKQGGRYAGSIGAFAGNRTMLEDAHKLRACAKAAGEGERAMLMAFAVLYRAAYYGTLPAFNRYGEVQPHLLKPLGRYSALDGAERCAACDPENMGYPCECFDPTSTLYVGPVENGIDHGSASVTFDVEYQVFPTAAEG